MIICVDGDGTGIQLKGRLLESEQKIGKETLYVSCDRMV